VKLDDDESVHQQIVEAPAIERSPCGGGRRDLSRFDG